MKTSSIHTLRAAAARWLIKKAACVLVTIEQGVDGRSRPDVLGCIKDGRLIEVEIKLSLADFKHNERKGSLCDRRWRGFEPSGFYFLAPNEVSKEMFRNLPEGTGLLTPATAAWHPDGVPKLEQSLPCQQDQEGGADE